MYFLLGLGVLLFFWLIGRGYIQANPAKLAKHSRTIGGIALLVFSAIFAVRGLVAIAAPMALFAMGLLGIRPLSDLLSGSIYNPNKSAGQQSRVQTDYLEMMLDHDSGALYGRVLSGNYQGAELSELSLAQLLELLRDYSQVDPQSAQLLMAFLDREHSEWRGQAGSFGNEDAGVPGAAGHITRDEALEILGVHEGASAREIKAAHKKLMKKFHPDQGGSDYFAAKINAAKDLLLGNA